MRIMIVDDCLDRALGVKRMLQFCFVVNIVLDANQTLVELSCNEYQAIIISTLSDQHCPLNLIRQIRAEEIELPILVLTKNGCSSNNFQLLELGADACITAPIIKNTLLAELNALLRRCALISNGPKCRNFIKIGDFNYDLVTNHLAFRNLPLFLSRTHLLITKCLMRHHPNIVSRYQLQSNVWEESWINRNNIDAQISRLRKKLTELTGFNPIKTERDMGYRFMVESK